MGKVYLVIGTVYGGNYMELYSDIITNDHCIYSTIDKAKAELYRILDEKIKEIKVYDYEIPFEVHMKKNRLEIIWTETGIEEHWVIHCCEVDKRI